tara:strand:+ start:13639 stop:14199 length:561 start_codon:yes stop_codon:yes gene_type:complete
MIILGIDPGSLKTGYGIIQINGKKTQLLDCGVLRFDSKLDLVDRLAPIHSAVSELVQKYNPDCVALESLIFAKSVPSLAKLAQARGAIITGLGEKYCGKIFEYAPTLVKSTVTGHGQATKEGVDKTLKMIFGKDVEFASNDASDAVAIALCHSLHGGSATPKLKSKSKSRSLKSVFANWEGARKKA